MSGAYGFLAGTWPFGVVELVWAFVAVSRYRTLREAAAPVKPPPGTARDHRATTT